MKSRDMAGHRIRPPPGQSTARLGLQGSDPWVHQMDCNRQMLVKFRYILSVSLLVLLHLLFLLGNPYAIKAEISDHRELSTSKGSNGTDPRAVANSLLKVLSGHPADRITSLKLVYDVHMDVGWKVKLKMSAILEMKKDRNGYISIFSLTEPIGDDFWSKFALSVFGKHTLKYKEMIKSVETRLQERYRLENKRFVTEELKEILPRVKKYENQSGIRVYFDHAEDLVKFWEDQTQAEFSKSMKYTTQVGPMAGFFNFVLFEKPETNLNIINALKQVEEVSAAGGVLSKRKKVAFLFGAETVKLGANTTGKHMDYPHTIYFERESYLDIIYGKNIYYKLVNDSSSKIKIPYAIHLDGIISKTKKRRRELRLKQLMIRHPDSRAYEEEMEAINAMDELAARNVNVLLREAKVVHE